MRSVTHDVKITRFISMNKFFWFSLFYFFDDSLEIFKVEKWVEESEHKDKSHKSHSKIAETDFNG